MQLHQQLTQLCQLTKGLAEEMQGKIEEEPLENCQQDDNDSWIDEQRGMNGEDLQLLAQDVMPARCMLVKVCRCLCVHVCPLWTTLPHSLTLCQGLQRSLHSSCSSARQLMDSPTISTPQWQELCKAHQLKEKNMPMDVHTCWNSAYIMLEFTIEYRDVINSLTSKHRLGLWDYEMDLAEWTLAKQLCDVLKVSVTANPMGRFSLITLTA